MSREDRENAERAMTMLLLVVVLSTHAFCLGLGLLVGFQLGKLF